MSKLTPQQDRVAQTLCNQFQWLHEHELAELTAQFGFADTTYGGWKFCEFIVSNNLLPQLQEHVKKYAERVKMRQNPPEDRIKNILVETLRCNANYCRTSSDNVESICLDVFPSLYSEWRRRQALGSGWKTMHLRRHISATEADEKINEIVNSMPARSIAEKVFANLHWRKAWLQALDLTLGASPSLLWEEANPNAVQVDRDILLDKRDEALRSAAAGENERRVLQREEEVKEAHRLALEEKRRDEEKKRAEEERKEKETATKKKCEESDSGASNYYHSHNYYSDRRYDYTERRDDGYARRPQNAQEAAQEESFIYGTGKKPDWY